MRRLAAATVMLTAVAVGAQAGGPPKPVRLVERLKIYHTTHYVRGSQGGIGSSGASTAAEARKDEQAPRTAEKPADKPAAAPAQAKAAKPGQKQETAPRRADD